MELQIETDYKIIISEVIKKQIVILGPDITLAKARNVKGLAITDDGTVTGITGNPQEIMQGLYEEFAALSEILVKKTMERFFSKITNPITVAVPSAS